MTANVVGFVEGSITSNLIDADTSIFFTSPQGIWQTQGEDTETSISLVFSESDREEFENFSFSLSNAVGGNGQLLFFASENEFGGEPWISDGTPEGTKILKDIHTNGSSNPRNFIQLDGTFYFTADDEENGRRLWRSDGTEEGTQLLSNIDLTHQGNVPPNFTNLNGTLLFNTVPFGGGVMLWRSDGTEAGTELIQNFSGVLQDITVIDDTAYFFTSQQLWRSDGTEAGTSLVAELSAPTELTSVNNTLFFVQRDSDLGEELWKSDGTPEGTVLVKDIRPEERVNGVAQNFGSTPRNLIEVDGTLFFTADSDGENRTELWKSDGTVEGTQLVKDFEDNIDVGANFISVDETLYFTRASQRSFNLWQSDGTELGTFAIEPEQLSIGGEQVIDSFILSSFDVELLGFNEQLYFTGQAYSFDEGNYQPALLTLADVDNTTVYRLFDPRAGVHFYTTDALERDEFIATGNYDSEGASYRSIVPGTEGSEEVFRFFNETTGVHLYTTSEVERDVIIDTLPDFTFQGARFSAYETEVEGSIPIYRFYEPTIGVHLYTPSEIERDAVEANLPNYNFEGIAYYALPLETEDL